eukprot:CAMPEP_0196159366 /NCGR_PEP_ID=MMETSP0910-20130528/46284_1 /TAXON_ID=49265 /ORGANISM="Thalassiosira rotula, Strain GSO102" /LENGTH=763 /DNA_ID=CAMNT_0041424285 /DNA_START=530 /DNA_END=2821 /DNA_ORIENTATION=-
MANFRLPFTRSSQRSPRPVRVNVNTARIHLWNRADSRNDHTSLGRSEHNSANFIKRVSSGGSSTSTFRITVPSNVRPGEEFQASAGERIVHVRCLPGAYPGQSLEINVPLDDEETASDWDSMSLQDLPQDQDSEHVTRISNQHLLPGEQSAYNVQIPEGVMEGQQFSITINGRPLSVTCPNMCRPGMTVKIVPPSTPQSTTTRPLAGRLNNNGKTRRFEVTVPKGVHPGKPFTLIASGVRVLVTCPINAISGQRIQFDLPLELISAANNGPKSALAQIKLSYHKDGWTRTVRASDVKFQWTRFDERGNIEQQPRFHTDRSAYVLKLDFLNDDRMRQGHVSLVTPEKGVVDSNIKRADGSELACYSDIANAQMKTYGDKIKWFQDTCAELVVGSWANCIKINVRRDCLVSDSMHAVMSLSREELRKRWRFEFIGEAGLDLGGLKKEWFELVTKGLFDPNMGLWQSSTTNQMCMQINPASAICCPEDHLLCFRFLGRVMGKAMFDGELVKGHMVNHLYKHLLGWPVMFNDLKDLDEVYFNSLKQMSAMGAEELQYVDMDFTATEDLLGMVQTVDLIPEGAGNMVTEDNLPEYLEACLRYRLLGRYEAQLNELLLGFYDVLPEPLLTIFDFQELELLMCGLPKIEMNDWMAHTEYSGQYDRLGPNHEVCVWFWDIVSDYDQEMKARLLQFVTGTSGVPANGFGSLQGNDGNIRRFTIEGVSLDMCVYPRSHTCFNRIDLPLYETRDELEDKLRIAVTMASTGFDLE